MKPQTTLRKALTDKALLGNVLKGDSWNAWKVLLIAAMGEPLREDERTIYAQLTQRGFEPGRRVEEFVGVIGRRGGKFRGLSVCLPLTLLACVSTRAL
jgi:hypothetical protein